MAIYLEFIDLIIPISNIDKVYAGGFAQFKQDNIKSFGLKMWHDDFLYRDGAMGALDMQFLCEKWEAIGLKGMIEIEGQRKWVEFCVFEGLFGGATLTCDWLEYDRKSNIVYLKGQAPGEIKGPERK